MGLNSLAKLSCGLRSENMYELKEILDRLEEVINKFADRIDESNFEDAINLESIPFYCRNILEAMFTSLIARIDPYRVLIVYKVQSDNSYDITKKTGVAIQWSGDVIANSKAKNNMWDSSNKIDSFDRAILGDYYGELMWKRAFIKAVDYIDANSDRYNTQWINNLTDKDEITFFEKSKTEAMKLFSAFSKGIHYEFLINTENIMDKETVKDYVVRLFELCAELALLSNFIDYMSCGRELDEAMNLFLEVERSVSNV